MPNKQPPSTSPPESDPKAKVPRRTPLWLAFVLPVLAVLVFFLLLESGLALFGLQPTSQTEDPFVGFSASPLYIPAPGPGGERMLTTAPNKKDYFNRQSFPEKKIPGSYRIFCLGGSTTYGRPYDDTTSFAGWLRDLLPGADKNKSWEVINAGGISYASYRVAKLMEELIQYQPDLFIIYTGHNEFLEERTYRELRDIPPLVRSTVSLLSHTRTWSAMKSALQAFNLTPHIEKGDRFKLGTEVGTILDQSAGPERYSRDDALRKNILNHYRISLERIVELARSVGAQVIFVAPASNLKDCSPFKSQHTDGISKAALQRSEELFNMSRPLVWEKDWRMALNFLDQAMKLDPRFADLQYRRGQALLSLGRYEDAKTALRVARDEDVCPLRALTSMDRIIADVAREQGVPLVDFKGLLERRMQSEQGYPIPGKEYFLDHVHPTIEGHKILALALLEEMAAQDMLQPGSDWGDRAIDAVTAKIEGGVDQAEQGRALANLARVMLWAGKNGDASRLATQALENAGEYRQVAVNAASTLATAYVRNGQPQVAVRHLYSYLEKNPDAVELRLKLGEVLLNRKIRNLEEAAANLLLVTQQMPYYDWAHALFGIDMVERGRPRIAYPSLMEALRLNPSNVDASAKLAQIRPSLEGQQLSQQPLQLQLERYPSSAPRKLAQGRLDSSGQFIPDGIEVEFHENGRLKRFLDIELGKAKGLEMTWDSNGKLLTRQVR